jgi:hypothetical protein
MNLFRATFAGFVATLILSLLMLIKGMMGIMPELNVIAMLATMMGTGPAVGWAAHFMIGALVWGTAFALLYGMLPGSSPWQKGIVFGIAAWLLMMVGVMPLANAGLFGLKLGLMAPVVTLMLHVLFGAILGLLYGHPESEQHAVA